MLGAFGGSRAAFPSAESLDAAVLTPNSLRSGVGLLGPTAWLAVAVMIAMMMMMATMMAPTRKDRGEFEMSLYLVGSFGWVDQTSSSLARALHSSVECWNSAEGSQTIEDTRDSCMLHAG